MSEEQNCNAGQTLAASGLFGVLQDVVGALQDGDADKATEIGEAALQEIHEPSAPKKYCLGGAILPLKAVEDEYRMWNWAVQDASSQVIKRFVLRDSARSFAERHNSPNIEVERPAPVSRAPETEKDNE